MYSTFMIGFQCMDAMKAVGNNDSVLDMGRSLYKLHFQLLLLLESANKMFTALCSTAQDNQVTAVQPFT